jgi:aryl-alcohol dehydrogenase-like predicted oxidoreductase
MRQKDFGKTGLKISEFGLGTWAMGGGIYGAVDDNESCSGAEYIPAEKMAIAGDLQQGWKWD